MEPEKIKQTGFVYKGSPIENSVKAENVVTDDNRQFISKTELAELKAKPGTTSPLSNNTVVFAQAEMRTNIQSKEALSTIAGKISKWFGDLGTAAFKGVSNSVSITADGYVADARVSKAINDKFGGCTLSQEGDDFYITGADSVKKKLGNGTIKRISLGSVSGDTTIDVKPHYADWKDLTIENFALDGCHGEKEGAQGENNWSGSYLEKNWDVSNGILTITKHIIGDPPYPLTVRSTVILFVSE